MGAMRFERLVAGLQGAEGPLLLPGGGVACVETMGGALTRVDRGAPERLAMVGGGPNGAAIGPDGRCYICNNGGLTPEDVARLSRGLPVDQRPPAGCIQTLDLATGHVATLYDSCDGMPLIAPNDLVFDAAGGFYFTDFNAVRVLGPLPGRVFYALPDGSAIRYVTPELERPNGVGLSPDGAALYVAETSSGRLWRFAVAAPGQLDAGTILFHDPALSLDSLAVQADGCVCIACPANDLVLRVRPDGSDERFATPPGGPTNICFGGADARTAWVTHLFSGEVFVAAWDAPGLRLHFQPD